MSPAHTDQGNAPGHADHRGGQTEVAQIDLLPLEGVDHLRPGAEKQPFAGDPEVLLDPPELAEQMRGVVERGQISDTQR